MSTNKRACHKLHEIIERLGGSMTYQRQGSRHGLWEISLHGKSATIPATGSRSFPQLDSLHVPDVPSPTTWYDYRDELVADAEQRLLALLV